MWDIMYKVNKKMNYVNFLLAICFNMVYKTFIRGVAQPGRVLGLGPRCRMFESCRPDHKKPLARVVFLLGKMRRTGKACPRETIG